VADGGHEEGNGRGAIGRRCEAFAAAKVGKEAGLFVASGTMGNLAAILSHATRGDEAVVGDDTHAYRYEAGGMSALGGVMARALPTDCEGRMDLAQMEEAVNPDDPHYARTRLILLENSYGAKNGAAIAEPYFEAVRRLAEGFGLAVHLDGARLFNAAAALRIPVTEITKHVDSVTFCLSKGLCAPVGSVLCGTSEFIGEARRARKVLGGGMRQAGVLAAAGVVALTEMIDRLSEDHATAKHLAEELAQLPGIRIEPEVVQTNMVFFELDETVPLSAQEVVEELKERSGILLGTAGHRRFRAVTHYWVRSTEVDQLVEELAPIVQS
jgi:threonine aldolase